MKTRETESRRSTEPICIADEVESGSGEVPVFASTLLDTDDAEKRCKSTTGH
jgi:hypothetical protein